MEPRVSGRMPDSTCRRAGLVVGATDRIRTWPSPGRRSVLACELLREAEKLVMLRIHPQTIIAGWRKAASAARQALVRAAKDHRSDAAVFRQDLFDIACTTLSSKLLTQYKQHFAKLAVDAVLRLGAQPNLQAIQIIKKTGATMEDSYLDEGFILDKKIGVGQPKRIENARILVANTSMDADKIKVFGSRVRVGSMAKVAEIEQAEKEKMKRKVDEILAHNINCFINRQLIYNYPEELFAEAGTRRWGRWHMAAVFCCCGAPVGRPTLMRRGTRRHGH